ncbi:hypothetical protein C0Q44_19170 [Paenibacillus sp. PCH8]|uniref:FAD-dependent oxidoreductase n=1 Tax=Paenibacillus sp. PCH8 TaxID=2066524 RepID=UPI000CF96146|nr:FAD-dependent oxidoreductase [Paenibacillus sp. PCH8]PQP81802.1 hypothetical protein C0Q44_19170 [Paenibacillus sp. PCH8]
MGEEETDWNRNRSRFHSGSELRSRSVAEKRDKLLAETIIVGGGVIGCAIAYELASRGVMYCCWSDQR